MSAAARSADATVGKMEHNPRPEPLDSLDADEAKIWRYIVSKMPPDWFPPETHILLRLYCQHVSGLKFLDKVIAEARKANNLVEWRKLIGTRRLECKAIAMLATKMRLAQQSSYDHKMAKVAKNKAVKLATQSMHPWS
jgi:hypothetical protein